MVFPFLGAFVVIAEKPHAEPLPIRNHKSSSLAFFRFVPESPARTSAKVRDRFGLVAANEYRITAVSEEDSEVWRLTWDRNWELGDHWSAFATLPVVSRGGGFLDGAIDFWHDSVLSDPDPFRGAVPRDRHRFVFPGADPVRPGIGFGDISGGLSYRFSERTHARVAVKLPTGNPSRLLGSGGLDLGIALDHQLQLNSHWTIHAHGGLSFQGASSRLSNVRGIVPQASLAFIYQPNRRDSWIAQWNHEASPLYIGNPKLDAAHRVISLGYRRDWGRAGTLTIFLSEDQDLGWTNFEGGAQIGPDVTFGVFWTRR